MVLCLAISPPLYWLQIEGVLMNNQQINKIELASRGESLLKELVAALKTTRGESPDAIMGLAYEFKSLLENNLTLSNYGIINRLIENSGYIHTAWVSVVTGDMSLETASLTFLRKEKNEGVNAVAQILSDTIPVLNLDQLAYYAAFDTQTMMSAAHSLMNFAPPAKISHTQGSDLSRFCLRLGMMNQQQCFTTICRYVNQYKTTDNHEVLVAQSNFLTGLSKEYAIAKRPDALDADTQEFFAEHEQKIAISLQAKTFPLPHLDACLTGLELGLTSWADTVLRCFDITKITNDNTSVTQLERFGSSLVDHHLRQIKVFYRLNTSNLSNDRVINEALATLLHYYLHSKESQLTVSDFFINRNNAQRTAEKLMDFSLIKNREGNSCLRRGIDKSRIESLLTEASKHMKQPIRGLIEIQDLKPILSKIDLYKRDLLSHDLSL